MKAMFRRSVFVTVLGLLAACAADPPLVRDKGPRTEAVRVVSNGWHTSIVVARPALDAAGLVPEARDVTGDFVEFGWGDRVYYPSKDPSIGMALSAALKPTPSVMHVAGLNRPPEAQYTGVEVITVKLSLTGLRNLIGAIAGEFKRPPDRPAAPVSRGLYRDSYFYDARGLFHLFNTCNTWTARTLRAGGVPISARGIITADDLVAGLREALEPR